MFLLERILVADRLSPWNPLSKRPSWVARHNKPLTSCLCRAVGVGGSSQWASELATSHKINGSANLAILQACKHLSWNSVSNGLLQMWNCQEGLVYLSNRDERKKAKGFKHNCSLQEPPWSSLPLLFFNCCSVYYSFHEIGIPKFPVVFFPPALFPILKSFNLLSPLSERATHNGTRWSPLANVCYVKKRFCSTLQRHAWTQFTFQSQ